MEANWCFWFSAWLMIRGGEKFWNWTNNEDEVAIKLDKIDTTDIWFMLSLVAISKTSRVSFVCIFWWVVFFHYDEPQIDFISPVMTSNANIIFFMVEGNFISGIFHLGSHANNTLSMNYMSIWILLPLQLFIFDWWNMWYVNKYTNAVKDVKRISTR